MSVFIGDKQVLAGYLGDAQVDASYLGDEQVSPSVPVREDIMIDGTWQGAYDLTNVDFASVSYTTDHMSCTSGGGEVGGYVDAVDLSGYSTLHITAQTTGIGNVGYGETQTFDDNQTFTNSSETEFTFEISSVNDVKDIILKVSGTNVSLWIYDIWLD